MVDSTSITFMVIQGIISIGIPIVCLIYFIKKYHISWKPILIGVLIFIVFAQVLESLLHQYMFNVNPSTKAILHNPYLYSLYAGLAAGIFEEGGRFIAFRFFLKKQHNWEDGLAYGIGHGGIEALLIGGLTSISLIANAYIINSGNWDTLIQASNGNTETLMVAKDQLIHNPAYMYLISGLERVFAFTHQLALSLLVLYGIRRQKIHFLLYAILAHVLIDFVAGLYQQFQFNIFIVEGFLAIVSVLAVIFIVKMRGVFNNETNISAQYEGKRH